MNSKINFNFIVVLMVALSIFVAFLSKTNSSQKLNIKQLKENKLDLPGTDTVGISYDLYYLKHPYLTKGDQFNDLSKYDSAIFYYKEASLQFARERQWSNYVWINSYIARLFLYVNGKNYEDALPFLQNAIDKGNQNLSKNHPYLATTYFYWGLYYYNRQMADKSLEMHNKAVQILLQTFHEENIYTSDVYSAIGKVYASLIFDNVEAERFFLKSIRIKESLPAEINKSGLTADYYNLVALYFKIGDYEKAQSCCYEAIKNVKYLQFNRFYWLELLEGVLANIYKEQQIYDKALKRLKNVIRINFENNGDKSYLSYYQTSLGDLYNYIGKSDSAIDCYNKALIFQKGKTLFYNQKEQTATTYYSLGNTYLKLKNYHKALFCFKKCLNLRLDIHSMRHPESAMAFDAIGNLFDEIGLEDSSLTYFNSAIVESSISINGIDAFNVPLCSEVNSSFNSYQIIRDKAAVLKKMYRDGYSDFIFLKASMNYYCLADTLMTLYRSKFERESAKLIFSKDNNSVYEEAIDCATILYQKTGALEYANLAYNFMDKRKSSLLTSSLSENQHIRATILTAKEQSANGLLKQQLAFLENQLEEEMSKESPDEQILKILHSGILKTEEKFGNWNDEINKNYPFYRSGQSKTDSLSLKDLQTYANKVNSAVLEYFWGDKAIYAIGVYNGKIELTKINRNEELDRRADSLKVNLKRGYVIETKETDFISYQRNSYFLYKILVNPLLISPKLQIKEKMNRPNIIVIPDGPLFYIPLDVLVTTDSLQKEVNYQQLNYLIKNYTVSYDYSSRLLLNNHGRQNTNPEPSILALSFSNDQSSKAYSGTTAISNTRDISDLPGSGKEITEIAKYLKGKFYSGNKATETVFKTEVSKYDIIHLAIHGVSDSLRSYNSRLVFKEGNDGQNDGNLYAYEVYSLPMKARLAVLSACESGLGKLNRGEGMYSMARGFIYAGCPSVIISCWKLNDNSTPMIISEFYREIIAGEKLDISLRKAKLDYIANGDKRLTHPGNWSGLIAIGDMSPLVKRINSGNKYLIWLSLFSFFVCMVFFIYRFIKYRFIK